MTISALDPVAALVLIDLQTGIVALPTAHSAASVVEKAAELAATWRRAGLPVILVNVDAGAPGRTEQGRPMGTPSTEWVTLVPELNVQDSDIRVTKRQWGAFTNTRLLETLKNLGATQIVLAGLMTTKGVESTARHAYELGFNVALAVDAMSDGNLTAHENSVANVFPQLGETGTTQEILALLQTRAS